MSYDSFENDAGIASAEAEGIFQSEFLLQADGAS